MILERYRCNIIGKHKDSVQTSYTTYVSGILVLAIGVMLALFTFEPLVDVVSSSWSEILSICSTGQAIAVTPVAKTVQGTLEGDTINESKEENKINADTSKNDKHVIYIYARQSQTNGEESASIETQVNKCREEAEKDGADEIIEFRDKDESGFSTEREGYQELMQKMQNDPRPVYVHRINRFGRSPLDGVAEIAKLHRECDLTLKTCKYGYYDLDDMDDLLFLFLSLIFAGKTVMQRIESAWEVIYQRFADEKNWHTLNDNVPVGYRLNDDGWIEPSDHGKAVVEAMANELIHADNRADVISHIEVIVDESIGFSSVGTSSNSGNRIGDLSKEQIKEVFEDSSYQIDSFDSQKLKRLLTNSVLIGKVRYPRYLPEEEQDELSDEDLQLLDEELFEEVNESIEETTQKYSTDSGKNVDMEHLTDHGMILRSIDIVDNIKPVCPECNHGMVKNGQDKEYPLEDGRIAHYWRCQECADNDDNDQTSPQRKVPHNSEWDAITNELDENYKDKDDIILLRLD
jgi:hypothetical protein